MVVRVGGEDRGVVLDRLLPPLALDGLVAHVAADRRRSLDVLLGHALEGLQAGERADVAVRARAAQRAR